MTLPSFIAQSVVLSDLDKEMLKNIAELPSETEIDIFRFLPEIQELTNAFIGDDSTRDTHLQLKAKAYLEKGEVESAWKVLLL